MRLGLVPALGGRLLALRHEGRELLYRNDRLIDARLHRRPAEAELPPLDGTLGSWRNYGGDKTWPAPQGWSGPAEWAGPPDPVLDSGPYGWSCERRGEEVVVTLRSAPDPRTGLLLERRVTLAAGASGFALELAMENASERPVRWALWNVTQVRGERDPDGGAWVGLDADAGQEAVVGLVAGTGTPRFERVAPDRAHVPDQDVVGKLGFPGACGWLAYVAGDRVLRQRWAVDRGAPHPDRGSRAEVWLEHPLDAPLDELGGLRPPDRVVECEVVGPLTELAPGARAELRIDWDVLPREGWEPAAEAATTAAARDGAEAGR
nr:DUF4380 domain-containing protein [Conexibacter arvalis]